MHSILQVCIPLFLPLVIKTTPQAVAGARPRNTTPTAPILLCRLEKDGRGWREKTELLL